MNYPYSERLNTSQNNVEDSDRLLTKAVNLLATVENRSTQEMIDLLNQAYTSQ